MHEIPPQIVEHLAGEVLDKKLDPRTLSDSELLAVSHVFLDEDCCLPPTEAVFAEIERRDLSGCK